MNYASGVCNIGPAEIARRRRAGHGGVLVTVALLAILLWIDADPAWRLLVAIPAAGAAAGYLQATFRFCANFGFRGVYNFGELGSVERVALEGARARDRRKALLIGFGSVAIGVAIALGSLAL